jgi:hypothetical protein
LPHSSSSFSFLIFVLFLVFAFLFLLFPLSSFLFPLPSSLFPLPSSLFPLPSSLFPLPSSLFPLPFFSYLICFFFSGGDDLIPLLTYVILRANIPGVFIESCIQEDFLDDTEVFGERAYMLATFSACLTWICQMQDRQVDRLQPCSSLPFLSFFTSKL